ncbi:MAG: FG-GAP-like repeat-containing protein, partial [Microthrixaceae bacterium]
GVDPAVSVFAGIGDGSFESPIDLPTGQRHLSAAVADLNGDLHADIVATDHDSDSVSVLLADGTGGFAASATYPTGIYPVSVAVGDLNGDAIPDLTVGNAGAPAEFPVDGSVSVQLGNGDGTFGAATTIASGGSFWSSRVGDLNGDGRPDAVASHIQAGRISVVLNTTPLRVPAPPAIGTANAGNGQATVSWTPPARNTWSPTIGYVVTPYVGFVSQGPRYFASTSTTQVVTGLTNGVAYRFKVRAWNAVGTSGFSAASNAVSPAVPTAPGVPTIGAATAGNGQATVTWSPPASDGGSSIIGYVVTPYVGYVSQGPRYFASTATTQIVTGLTNGTTYRFKVRAWNAAGASGFSATSNAVMPAP